MARSGVDVLIFVNTATLPSGEPDNDNPVYTKVAGQRNMTMNQTKDTIETTNKCSPGAFKEFISSFKEWSMDFDGLIELTDGGYDALRSVWLGTEPVKVQQQINTIPARTITGLAHVTDLSEEAPQDDAHTFTATLQGTGNFTTTP